MGVNKFGMDNSFGRIYTFRSWFHGRCNNRDKFGILPDAKLQGVIITSYIEPHISIPNGFINISIEKLNKVFDKPTKIPEWKKAPILRIPEEILRQAHKKERIKI